MSWQSAFPFLDNEDWMNIPLLLVCERYLASVIFCCWKAAKGATSAPITPDTVTIGSMWKKIAATDVEKLTAAKPATNSSTGVWSGTSVRAFSPFNSRRRVPSFASMSPTGRVGSIFDWFLSSDLLNEEPGDSGENKGRKDSSKTKTRRVIHWVDAVPHFAGWFESSCLISEHSVSSVHTGLVGTPIYKFWTMFAHTLVGIWCVRTLRTHIYSTVLSRLKGVPPALVPICKYYEYWIPVRTM